jgi:hypothetical protein
MESREKQDEAEAAERIEQLKREQIVLGNGHAIPKNSSPLNGISKYSNGSTPAAPRPVSPMLEAIGFSSNVIASLDQIAQLREQAKIEAEKALADAAAEEVSSNGEGSRGMPRLSELDQRLMTIGDELSNDAEELRAQRSQPQRKRLKNQRLRTDDSNEPAGS